MPALAYIEYSIGDFKASQAALMGLASAVSAALGLLYAALLVMNRRYAKAKERENRDRELVELGQAARTIAHEIKNPLGVIRIQCGVLRKQAGEDERAGLEVIDAEAVRLANLADRIRDYLRSSDAARRTVGAKAFAEAFAARYSGMIDSAIDVGADARVSIDEARMTEALDNIVANALEASDGAAEKPLFTASARQRRLALCVLDRGPGVPAEDRPRLFEPFFTTKEKGSGLGLALARKTIEASGGRIAYADRPGGGASFTVYIELAR